MTTNLLQGLLSCSLKIARWIWSKATYKNELSKKNSAIVWASPRYLYNQSQKRLITFYSHRSAWKSIHRRPRRRPQQVLTEQLEKLVSADKAYDQWCRFMLSIGGNNLQFYPNFVLFTTLGEMKLDHYFFHESKSIEDQKKAFTETWRVFVSKIKWRPKNKVQRSTSVQMQTIVKLLGGMQSNYWGGYIRPIPPGFGTPAYVHAFARFVSGRSQFEFLDTLMLKS